MIKHTVKSGETLGTIAAMYLGSASKYREIAAVNPQITNLNLIRVGEVLNIPSQASTNSYTVPASPTPLLPVTQAPTIPMVTAPTSPRPFIAPSVPSSEPSGIQGILQKLYSQKTLLIAALIGLGLYFSMAKKKSKSKSKRARRARA